MRFEWTSDRCNHLRAANALKHTYQLPDKGNSYLQDQYNDSLFDAIPTASVKV